MACFHPLLGVVVDHDVITGKKKMRIEPYDETKRKRLIADGFQCIDVPCGKCIGCRIEYSRQWANRMMLELQYHDSAYFVTLTYSDDFLPRNPVFDEDTGEYLMDSFSLRKKHLSKFMKHLRKHFPDQKLRFFGVGEYGPTKFRPHYHIIIFGLKLDDLKVYKRTQQGDVLYTSKSLNECWSNYLGKDSSGVDRYDQIGWCVVAPVTWETCAYCARYVTKKMSGPLEKEYDRLNLEPPFSLMSRRPGIARQWYEDHPNWTEKEFINVSTSEGARKFRPPRYFDKLLENDCPEEFVHRQQERGSFFEKKRLLIEQTIDKSYLDYLADKEVNLKSRLKSLDRSKA